MTFYSLLESFFFLSLGLSFVLILLMVYHFKKRMDSMDKKINAITDITRTIVDNSTAQVSMPPRGGSAPNLLNPFFNMPKPNEMGSVLFTQNPHQSEFDFPPDWKPAEGFYKNIIVSEDMLDSQPPILQYKIDENEEASLNDVESCSGSSVSKESTDDSTKVPMEVVEFTVDESAGYNIVHEVSDMEDEDDGEDDDDDKVEAEDEVKSVEQVPIVELDDTEKQESPKFLQIEDPDTLVQNDTATVDESVLTEYGVEPSTVFSKKSLQKMNVQMLRTMVIRDGLAEDPSKMKKLELVQLLLDSQKESL
jgi:hypothetical protein